MSDRTMSRLAIAAGTAALAVTAAASARPALRQAAQVPLTLPMEKKLVVPAAGGWIDTGIDVGPGEEILLQACGEIILHRGNPEAACGPGALDIVTVEQPLPNALALTRR